MSTNFVIISDHLSAAFLMSGSVEGRPYRGWEWSRDVASKFHLRDTKKIDWHQSSTAQNIETFIASNEIWTSIFGFLDCWKRECNILSYVRLIWI